MDDQISYIDVVNLAIALFGAVCGALAVYHQFLAKRIRLKVIPKISFLRGKSADGMEHWIQTSNVDKTATSVVQSGKFRFCIEVINLSDFPVYLSAAGLMGADGTLAHFYLPHVSVGKTFPCKLESREAVSIHADAKWMDPLKTLPIAFVNTDCDHRALGTSSVLEMAIEQMREASTGK